MTSIALTQGRVKTPAVFHKATNVRHQTPPKSFRIIFWTLLAHYENEPFELNASWLVNQIGYSRKTIYKALRFLCGIKLVELVEARRGRGNHSIYRVRWQKREVRCKSVTSAPIKRDIRQNRSTESSRAREAEWQFDRSRRVRYLTSGWTTLRNGHYGFKRAAKLFRLSSWELGMPQRTAETISGLLLRRLEGHRAEVIARVHDELFFRLWSTSTKLQRLLHGPLRKLCAWVAWLLGAILPRVLQRLEAKEREFAEWERECDATEAGIEATEARIEASDRPTRLRHALQRFLCWRVAMEGLLDGAALSAEQAQYQWTELVSAYRLGEAAG